MCCAIRITTVPVCILTTTAEPHTILPSQYSRWLQSQFGVLVGARSCRAIPVWPPRLHSGIRRVSLPLSLPQLRWGTQQRLEIHITLEVFTLVLAIAHLGRIVVLSLAYIQAQQSITNSLDLLQSAYIDTLKFLTYLTCQLPFRKSCSL